MDDKLTIPEQLEAALTSNAALVGQLAQARGASLAAPTMAPDVIVLQTMVESLGRDKAQLANRLEVVQSELTSEKAANAPLRLEIGQMKRDNVSLDMRAAQMTTEIMARVGQSAPLPVSATAPTERGAKPTAGLFGLARSIAAMKAKKTT